MGAGVRKWCTLEWQGSGDDEEPGQGVGKGHRCESMEGVFTFQACDKPKQVYGSRGGIDKAPKGPRPQGSADAEQQGREVAGETLLYTGGGGRGRGEAGGLVGLAENK